MYPHDENEALAVIAQKFPDNTTGAITPLMAREGFAAVIAHTKNQPPNFSPGTDLRNRFETAAQLLAAGGVGAGDCLEQENDTNFCLGMLAWVEFPAGPGFGVTFRLMYDGNPARTLSDSGIHAYRTGRMVAGSRLQAKWVRLSDPVAGVPTYDYLQSIAGVGGYLFAAGDPVRDFAGTNAEYFFAAKAAGQLPAPTSANGDANWRRIAPEQVQAAAPYRVLEVVTAQALAADADQIQPIRYRILRGANGDVETYGLPTDQTNNLPGAFRDEVDWQNPATGRWERKHYDVATNMVTAPVSGLVVTNYLQISSENGQRVAEIPVLSPVALLEEIFDLNVIGVDYQLDLNTRGPVAGRVFGAPSRSKAQLLDLLAALTLPDYAAGVKLYARAIVSSVPDPAVLILKFQYA